MAFLDENSVSIPASSWFRVGEVASLLEIGITYEQFMGLSRLVKSRYESSESLSVLHTFAVLLMNSLTGRHKMEELKEMWLFWRNEAGFLYDIATIKASGKLSLRAVVPKVVKQVLYDGEAKALVSYHRTTKRVDKLKPSQALLLLDAVSNG